MKLGFIRIPDLRPTSGSLSATQNQLSMADRLGFHLAYLPKIDPQEPAHFINPRPEQLRIGFDASTLGHLSPGEMETAVRRLNDGLGGRLHLGVRISCEDSSIKGRADAQNFETMFSHGPKQEKSTRNSRFPMKSPCPRIIGVPVTGAAEEASVAAARGYLPLTPSWLTHRAAARHWPAIVGGATSALHRAMPTHWQLARTIVVHDDPATVNAYVYGTRSPIRKHYTRLAHLGLIGPNVDEHLKKVVVAGSANHVAHSLLALQETVGEIGTLHMVAHEGCDLEMNRKTMIGLAESVIPLVANSSYAPAKMLEST